MQFISSRKESVKFSEKLSLQNRYFPSNFRSDIFLKKKNTGEQIKKLLKVTTLEAGQFFGDVEILSGATHAHREFTIVGVTEMELLVLRKEEFFNRITPGILQMFREQVVHKYPSDNEIIDAFLDERKNKRWVTYKVLNL